MRKPTKKKPAKKPAATASAPRRGRPRLYAIGDAPRHQLQAHQSPADLDALARAADGADLPATALLRHAARWLVAQPAVPAWMAEEQPPADARPHNLAVEAQDQIAFRTWCQAREVSQAVALRSLARAIGSGKLAARVTLTDEESEKDRA